MKKVIKQGIIGLLLGTVIMNTVGVSADTGGYTGSYIGQGTFYQTFQTGIGTNYQTINVIESIYGSEYIKIEANVANGPIKNMNVLRQAQEKDLASNGKVIGAINGDFFDMTTIKGLAYGTTIVAGEVITAVDSYTVFGVTSEGKPFIDKLNMTANMTYQDKAYPITGVNRLRWGGQTMVYTPAFGASTQTKDLGTEIVVRGVELPLSANKPMKGTIEAINLQSSNTAIPTDGIVISVASGLAVTELMHLTVGSEIEVNIAFNHADVVQAIGGAPRVLDNSGLSVEINTHVTSTQRNPRTAIGIKNDRIVMVTVGGRKAGSATGMNLPEFGNYLKTLGITDAINLDGGGSTTMVARLQGNSAATLVNVPSDTSMRSVGNSLQIVSYAPISVPTYIKAVEKSVVLEPRAKYNAQIMILDQYYNKLNATVHAKFSVEGDIGTIDATGAFTAGDKEGSGKIIVQIDGGKTCQVTVKIKTKTATEAPSVVVPPVTPTEPTAPVDPVAPTTPPATSDADVIASLETLDSVIVSGVRAEAVAAITGDAEYVKGGNGALKIDYKMLMEEGTSAVYMKFKNAISIPEKAKSIGMWVYGDEGNNWLRAYANSRKTVLNFTIIDGLNWKGWQYVEAKIPEEATKPIILEEIYFVQTDNLLKKSGTLYFDEIKVLY